MNKQEKDLLVEILSMDETFTDKERRQMYSLITEGDEESYKDSEVIGIMHAFSDDDKYNVDMRDIQQVVSEMDSSLSLTNGLRLARLSVLAVEGMFNIFPAILENAEKFDQESGGIKTIKLILRTTVFPGNIFARGLRKLISAVEPIAESIDSLLLQKKEEEKKKQEQPEQPAQVAVNDNFSRGGDVLLERWNHLAGTTMLSEARPRKNPRHDLETHPGISMAHADTTGVNCDFNTSWMQMLQKQVWSKLGSLHYVGDWSMPDGGDGYRFINGILQCRCKETGMIMMAVYCVDRANSYNATKTSYDVYVIDVEDVQENHTEYGSNDISDRDLSSSSREWAKKGEYCTNVQQIVDTLKDAYDHYKKLLDSGQI